jgi:tRNA modification GTPase
LNRLAGQDAAIVTDIPGTTRDTLKHALVLDGLPVNVVDTAGLRSTVDPIEVEGVRRARQEASEADHVLWVADIRESRERAQRGARAALEDGPGYTLIMNKVDLVAGDAKAYEQDGVQILELSALTGAGVDLLIGRLKQLAGLSGETSGTFSARRRHLEALARVADHLSAAGSAFAGGLELAAEELRAAQTCLSGVTGELTSDDLLGEIFSRFCIGK